MIKNFMKDQKIYPMNQPENHAPLAKRKPLWRSLVFFSLALLMVAGGALGIMQAKAASVASSASLQQTIDAAASEFSVPSALLLAISYQESRLSSNGWHPSIDGGYGYMHLVKNKRVDTLARAASLLNVSTDKLKSDMATNIRGGAAILHDEALRLNNNALPANLADWYATVAEYSTTNSQSVAQLYADEVYKLLAKGFSQTTTEGETLTLQAQAVTPNKAQYPQQMKKMTTAETLPEGCSTDKTNIDYPDAISCIIPPERGDCARSPDDVVCNYDSIAQRPDPMPIDRVVIHDIEGTAEAAVSAFLNPEIEYDGSAHYVIDGDGNVYQTLREKDTAYHAGNYWYNQHSIGIEHEGYADTGYQWYSAAEYLASAKLVAYLVDKYHISLDKASLPAHGEVPAPGLNRDNHHDPGPYWMWSYYLNLVDKYSAASLPRLQRLTNTITVLPKSSLVMEAGNHETAANFNYFYLYKEPSTKSDLIAKTAFTYEGTNNIEADVSYTYTEKKLDQGGSGVIMYKITYGLRTDIATPGVVVDAWLAVPRGAGFENLGFGHRLQLEVAGQTEVKVYGRPTTPASGVDPDYYYIGTVPQDAYVISTNKIQEDNSTRMWYLISYNHRQAWVPADYVTAATRY
jgi:N-acetyl-anhydromuramyl-L-alanine amidase AmpD